VLDQGRGVDAGREIGGWAKGEVAKHNHISPWVNEDSPQAKASDLYAGTIGDVSNIVSGLVDITNTQVNNHGNTVSTEDTLYTSYFGEEQNTVRNLAFPILVEV